jgi:hypothetical protein
MNNKKKFQKVCYSEGTFSSSDIIVQYSNTFDGKGFTIYGLQLVADVANIGLIGQLNPGGSIKDLTILSSSISILDNGYRAYIGFFFGRCKIDSGSSSNITISNCHSINNTISHSSTTNSLQFVGFIGGSFENYVANLFILVDSCSTKYSSFNIMNWVNSYGANFGNAGNEFFFFFSFFF